MEVSEEYILRVRLGIFRDTLRLLESQKERVICTAIRRSSVGLGTSTEREGKILIDQIKKSLGKSITVAGWIQQNRPDMLPLTHEKQTKFFQVVREAWVRSHIEYLENQVKR